MRLLKIGRDATCDIVMHSDKVSSLHAELTLLNSGDIMLEDKGSRNGTFIMNQPIKPNKPVSVRRGDAIRFADVELQWSQVPQPEDNSAYQGVYGIGSHFNNDFQISGATVSRYHATVKHGRDGKMYILDHSKNGTTVDGTKIPSNTPVRIKKKSAVVCGGVPVDLSRLPWPGETWKYVLGIAASLLLVFGVGFGVYKTMDGWQGGSKKYTDGELYAKYNKSVVMLVGIYHYNVTMGDLDIETLNRISNSLGLINTFKFSSKVFLARDRTGEVVEWIDASNASSKEYIEYINNKTDNQGIGTATGFFISQDGQLITNLHVVKPWLFDDNAKMLEEYRNELTYKLSRFSEILISNQISLGLSAYISQLKVEGEMDYIGLVPQGDDFDPDNMIKCKVLSASDNKEKDVALLQTITKRLPTSDCTYINVKDSIDFSDDCLTPGNHVYTIGFPAGMNIQDMKSGNGIQVYAQGGSIIQKDAEFEFSYNAATTGGASGSPVFNEYGMLIGIHHAGLSQSGTQGYNYGIKAKYIKELLDNPHVVK